MAEQTDKTPLATPAASPAPVRPAWLGGPTQGDSSRPNLWSWTWKTSEGYSETWQTRGPETEAGVRKVIAQILGAMTQHAIDSGAKDPGLTCTALRPMGRDESPFDGQQPAATRPANIFQFGNPPPQSAEEAAALARSE